MRILRIHSKKVLAPSFFFCRKVLAPSFSLPKKVSAPFMFSSDKVFAPSFLCSQKLLAPPPSCLWYRPIYFAHSLIILFRFYYSLGPSPWCGPINYTNLIPPPTTQRSNYEGRYKEHIDVTMSGTWLGECSQ